MKKPTFQFSTQYNSSFQHEFQDLLEAFEILQNEHESLLATSKALLDQKNKDKKKIEELNKQLQNLIDSTKIYETQQKEINDILDQETSSNHQSAFLTSLSTGTINQQEKQIKSLTSTLQSLNSEHQEDWNKREQQLSHKHQQELQKQQATIQSLTETLQSEQEYRNNKETEMKAAQKTNQQLTQQIATLKTQNTELSEQIATLQSQIESLKSNHDILNGLIKQLKGLDNEE